MSYRKLQHNGKEYEYVIGKSHTKIKNVGIFKNDIIGSTVMVHSICECCGEPLDVIYNTSSRRYIAPVAKIAVTPSDIVKILANQ